MGLVKNLPIAGFLAGVLFFLLISSFQSRDESNVGLSPYTAPSVSVRQFGAVPDDGQDDTQAIQAALNSGAWDVVVDPGKYHLSAPLYISAPITFRGYGGFLWQPGVLEWTKDTTGIIINHDGVILSKLALKGKGKNLDSLSNGVEANKSPKIEYCTIFFWGGNGIDLNSIGVDQNVNRFKLLDNTITNCGGAGIFTEGGDANAGYGLGNSITHCRVGKRLSDFLGNSWYGSHLAANDTAIIQDNVNAHQLFSGLYTEQGQAICQIKKRSLAIGGEHGTPFNRSDIQGTATKITAGFPPFDCDL